MPGLSPVNSKRTKPKEILILDPGTNRDRDWREVFVGFPICICANLNWHEKILLGEIDYLCMNEDKICNKSNKYFAHFLHVSSSSITKYISHLKRLEMIKEISFNGRERRLKVKDNLCDDLLNNLRLKTSSEEIKK